MFNYLYPIIFRLINFKRFRGAICRFSKNNFLLESKAFVGGGGIVLVSGRLVVGAGTYIGEYANIRCVEDIKIGKNCKIAQFVTIVDSDYDFTGSKLSFDRLKSSPVIIGDNTFIGAGVVICRGVHIKPGSIVPANTRVSRNDNPYRP